MKLVTWMSLGEETDLMTGKDEETYFSLVFVSCVYVTYSNNNLKKENASKKMEKGKIIILVLCKYYRSLTFIKMMYNFKFVFNL